MNRTERILCHARRETWLALVFLSVACASGVWAAVAWLHGRVPGGALLAAATIAVLRLSFWHWSERRRLRGKVLRDEMRWNPQGTPRQPHDPEDLAVWVALAVVSGVPAFAAFLHLLWKMNQ